MARCKAWLAAGLAVAAVGRAGAINVVLDYSYDTQGFFSNAAARATLEKAAADFSAILTDTFSPIVVPADYLSDANGQASPVVYSWDWSIKFDHPGVNGGPTVTINEPSFIENEYRVYAGGRSLAGSTLGVGGPGGSSYSEGGSYYLQEELDEINAISAAFEGQRNRGQSSGFARWGGSITFDTDAGTIWNYDWQTEPTAGQSDLYSVALHELAHALGFGTSTEWSQLLSGGFFVGAASIAENPVVGPVAIDGGLGHWANNTMSTVLRDGAVQEAAMDPTITSGTRKLLTDLDIAGLDDIGWDINAAFTYGAVPGDTDGDSDIDDFDLINAIVAYTGSLAPGVGGKTVADGDTDDDGDVDDFDLINMIVGYTGSLSNPPVPEPASAALLTGLLGLVARRRRA